MNWDIGQRANEQALEARDVRMIDRKEKNWARRGHTRALRATVGLGAPDVGMADAPTGSPFVLDHDSPCESLGEITGKGTGGEIGGSSGGKWHHNGDGAGRPGPGGAAPPPISAGTPAPPVAGSPRPGARRPPPGAWPPLFGRPVPSYPDG